MPPKTPEKGNWMMKGSRLALMLILSGCANDSNNDAKTTLDNSSEQMNQIEINLSNTETSDISNFKGKPVTFASLSYNDIEDLSPLKGAPLEHLDIAYTLITTLEPLRGNTTLQELDIRETEIDDLSPLSHAPLNLIFLNKSASDLSPIKDAIEDGANVFPPMGYGIDKENWRLVKI